MRKVAPSYHKVIKESAMVNTYLRVESKHRSCAMMRQVAPGYHKVMEESTMVNSYLRVESKPRSCAMIRGGWKGL